MYPALKNGRWKSCGARWRNDRSVAGESKKILDKAALLCYNAKALEGAPKYRGVEQLEARRAHNPEVVGSSPASATIKSTENNLFSVLFICF